MKKTFCISLLMMVSLGIQCTYAQSVECFPKGTAWKEVTVEQGEPMDTTHCILYEIGTDTIAGGTAYHKVLRNGTDAGLLVCEREGRVWVRAEDFPEEVMIYDFNWDDGAPIRTEYVRVNGDVAEKCVDETDPVDTRSAHVDGCPLQYYIGFSGAEIRNIGRVTELNRDACLLGYKVEEPVIPGLIYWKVLWLKRDGHTVFSSYSPNEWTTFFPRTKEPLRGDLDGNGDVDRSDVMTIVNIILNGK